MSYRSASRWVIPAAFATICCAVGCRDQLLSPTLKKAAVRTSTNAPTLPGCAADCLIADGIAPLLAALPLADSASATIGLGSAEIVGSPGDSIVLKVDADENLLAAIGGQERLVVSADSRSSSYPISTLIAGVVVYRFETQQSVRISYQLTRNIAAVVPDGGFRVHQFTSATVRRLFRPWLSGSNRLAPLSGTQCPITQALSYVCGDTVTVAPFFAPPENIGGTFTSHMYTTASNTITITFSRDVNSVTVTIYDPTYAGNTIVAYDSAGTEIGEASFAFSGVPGVNIQQTWDLTVDRIRRVELIPAPADFVSYDVSFAQPPCPPSNDPILDQKSVRDSITAAFNRSNPDAPPGAGTGGKQERSGWVWQMPDGSYLAQDLTNPSSTECASTSMSNPTPPAPGAVHVANFHTHPSFGGEPIYGCLAFPEHYPQFVGDSGVVGHAVGDANGGGSDFDWIHEFLPGSLPEYVINKDGSVWRLNHEWFKRPARNPNQWFWKTNPGCFMPRH